MKKIINGKLYDTEKSEKIGSSSSSVGPSDFNYYEESLYMTENGSYFIAGEGGPFSHYSVRVGNNGSGGGSNITEVTNEEALRWAENSDMSVDEILEHFEIQDA